MCLVLETQLYEHISDLGVYRPYPETDFDDRIIYWHVVRLIGWGIDDNGLYYWLCVNSFGHHWGDNGK
jgi:hypothetical protein